MRNQIDELIDQYVKETTWAQSFADIVMTLLIHCLRMA